MPFPIRLTLLALAYLLLRGAWGLFQHIQSVHWHGGGDPVVVDAVTVAGKAVPLVLGCLLAWGVWQRRFGYARVLRALMLLGLAATLAGFIVGVVRGGRLPDPLAYIFLALYMLPMGVVAFCLYRYALKDYWRT